MSISWREGKVFSKSTKTFRFSAFFLRSCHQIPVEQSRHQNTNFFEMAMRTMREIMMKVNFYEVTRLISQPNWNTAGGLKPGPQSKRILGKNIIIITTIIIVIIIIIFMVIAAAGPRLSQYRSSSVMVMTMVGGASQPLVATINSIWMTREPILLHSTL